MTQLLVDLREDESGRVVGRYALPAHATSRLIAEAHLEAVASGALPNDGAPLAAAGVSLVEADASSALAVSPARAASSSTLAAAASYDGSSRSGR